MEQTQNKEQLIIIGGGLSFRNSEQAKKYFEEYDIDKIKPEKNWKNWLKWSLEEKYDFLTFKQPMVDDAKYDFWKLVFEKYFVKFNDQKLSIIAHSLGTIFILKYLIENNFPKKIKQLHLVAPIVSNKFQPENDPEDTSTFTFDISQVERIKDMCEEVHIWHSKDDTMCDYKNAEYLVKNIPGSFLHTFENRGHFFQSTFWELFDTLRK